MRMLRVHVSGAPRACLRTGSRVNIRLLQYLSRVEERHCANISIEPNCPRVIDVACSCDNPALGNTLIYIEAWFPNKPNTEHGAFDGMYDSIMLGVLKCYRGTHVAQ